MPFFTVIAMSGLLASTPVAEASMAQPSAAIEKQVCKSRGQTGTRFRKKTCRTAQQWEQMAETAKRNAGDMINRPNVPGERGN